MGWDEKEEDSRVRKEEDSRGREEKEGKGRKGKGMVEGNECCDSVTVSAPCECIEEQWVVH